jgi:endonuclease/exonuclease/phosphatase family metal-dependent hydrolase
MMTEMVPPQIEQGTRGVSLLSYNVHSCVGLDGRPDVERIARIIREQNPDVVGLQEITNTYGRERDARQADYIAEATGMRALGGPTLLRESDDYGNALLTRGRIRSARRIDLSFEKREPRGALDAELELAGNRVRVIVTHLGLLPAERRFQVRRLYEVFGASPLRPLVLMGDMNEWLPWGRPARWLHRYFGRLPLLRTYPTSFPLFALDQILVSPREALLELQVIATPQARVASDHLPLKAFVGLR